MAKQMDYEYAAYGDYDAYNDITDIGPMYTRDDVKVGTYFDEEDHGEPPTAPPSKPPPGHPEYNINQGGGDGNNNKGNAGGTQLGSGMTTGQHAAFRK